MLRGDRLADVAFVVASVGAAVLLLWFSSGSVFFLDEWRYIAGADDWSFAALMEPYNQHWSLTLKLAWNSLMATAGMRSYVPYHLLMVLLHISVATGLYVYARRQTHALVALAVGVLVLFLGTGSTNLLYAGALNHVIASAAGTWALVIMLREPGPRRAWLATLLLLAAAASAGTGLFFVAAVAALVILTPDLRRLWWVVVPAGLAFAAWYLTFGRTQSTPLPELTALLEYVRDGFTFSIVSVSGLDALGQVTDRRDTLLLVVAIAVILAAVVGLVRRSSPGRGLLAGAAGLLSLWLGLGLTRAALDPGSFTAERFIYVAAIFILVGLVGWLGGRSLGSLRHPDPVLAGIGIVLTVAVAWNVLNLVKRGDSWHQRGLAHRAAIAITLEHGGVGIPADQGWRYEVPGNRLTRARPGEPIWIPDRAGLEALIARYGSPLDDPLAFGDTNVPVEVYEATLAEAFGGSADK